MQDVLQETLSFNLIMGAPQNRICITAANEQRYIFMAWTPLREHIHSLKFKRNLYLNHTGRVTDRGCAHTSSVYTDNGQGRRIFQLIAREALEEKKTNCLL